MEKQEENVEVDEESSSGKVPSKAAGKPRSRKQNSARASKSKQLLPKAAPKGRSTKQRARAHDEDGSEKKAAKRGPSRKKQKQAPVRIPTPEPLPEVLSDVEDEPMGDQLDFDGTQGPLGHSVLRGELKVSTPLKLPNGSLIVGKGDIVWAVFDRGLAIPDRVIIAGYVHRIGSESNNFKYYVLVEFFSYDLETYPTTWIKKSLLYVSKDAAKLAHPDLPVEEMTKKINSCYQKLLLAYRSSNENRSRKDREARLVEQHNMLQHGEGEEEPVDRGMYEAPAGQENDELMSKWHDEKGMLGVSNFVNEVIHVAYEQARDEHLKGVENRTLQPLSDQTTVFSTVHCLAMLQKTLQSILKDKNDLKRAVQRCRELQIKVGNADFAALVNKELAKTSCMGKRVTDKRYPCNICRQKVYKNRASLGYHMKRFHIDGEFFPCKKDMPPHPVTGKVVGKCGFVGMSAYHLRDHDDKIHVNPNEERKNVYANRNQKLKLALKKEAITKQTLKETKTVKANNLQFLEVVEISSDEEEEEQRNVETQDDDDEMAKTKKKIEKLKAKLMKMKRMKMKKMNDDDGENDDDGDGEDEEEDTEAEGDQSETDDDGEDEGETTDDMNPSDEEDDE